ncbi:discoidin domain-containing protein [Actinacidiphila acididurans]|uniref:Discoidin domain-containing protein n=1 Tax=Actinacidiphila acididurans TaxID=2784346 RepID=A0ABS2TT36_9ACTN|nr:discoidin domain-containing protein [Actinacidiphila acididurans]MBM9506499.1 discoidin domain-containing protein [Actinacidiphila acididurans]
MHHRSRRPAALRTALGVLPILLASAATGAGAAAAAPAPSQPGPIVYSVAPDGAGGACTAQAPCDLETAQAKVRGATAGMSRDIDVVLADGTYRLGRALTFDAAKGDSATGGHTVTYEAAPGAHPVLSGGRRVAGWHQGPDGVWSANVPAGTDTRQLYVDGVRAVRASGPAPTGFTRTPTGYTTSTTALDAWRNISDVEFVYNVGWTQMRCQVASVAGTTVTMQQPCFDNSTKKPYGVNADLPSSVENARELLNDPGEFYLDRPAHTLYYKPRPGQSMATADAEIPRLQTVIAGQGTQASPLRGLVLRGLTVSYGGWTAPDAPDGFSEVQANLRLTGTDAWRDQGSCDRFSTTDPGTCPYGNWTMPPGNAAFSWTDGLTLQGNTFQHLGAAGLELGRGTAHTSVTGNVVTDVSGNGIEVGNGTDAVPADLSVLPTANTVADNWVHNIGVEYTGAVGIFQGYTRDDTITHNQVNNVPYSGISSNWGWGHTPTATAGNTISDNLVYDYMQQRYDGGGIYVLGQEGDSLADGMRITGNVIRGAGGGGHAIYTDGGSQYVTMTGNAAYGNHTPSMGGCKEPAPTPYGDFSFTGNYFEDLTPDWPCGNPANVDVSGNTQVSADGAGVPASLLAGAGLEPAFTAIAAPPAGSAPVNLAAHKPAQAQFLDGSTAQLQPESQPAYATDGDRTTYVQASGQFRWQLVVDLQQAQTLGYVTVGMPQAHFATDFHLDASADGTSWTTVGTVHDSGWGTIPVDFATPVTARYLRVVADKPDDWGQRGDQMAISEIGAYAPAPGGDNAALNRPAQALYIDGTQAQMQPDSQPAYGDDGNPATFAQATARYRWTMQVDLQHPQSVGVVSVTMPPDKYATAFHVDVSLDGSTFWTVAHRTDSAGGTTGVQLDAPVKARWVRIVADRPNDGGQTGGQMAVSELAVYATQ